MRIHTCEEHQVGRFGLDRGEDRHEIGRFIGGVFARDNFRTGRLGGLGKFICQPLTIGSAIINHGDFFGAKFINRKLTQHMTLLFVVSHHAKRSVVALCGIRNGCSGRRYLRDAGGVINSRCRNGRTGIEVADNADNATIHQLLRDGRGGLWIGLVVLAQQVNVHFLAAQSETGSIDFIHSQACAIFVVLAQMRLRSGKRRHRTNLDDVRGSAVMFATTAQCQCSHCRNQ